MTAIEQIAIFLHEKVDYSHGKNRSGAKCPVCRENAAEIIGIVRSYQCQSESPAQSIFATVARSLPVVPVRAAKPCIMCGETHI